MARETGIEWADSTQNLQMGCEGCELWTPRRAGKPEPKTPAEAESLGMVRTCYAGNLTRRYEGLKGWPAKFENPVIFPERLGPMLAWSDLTGEPRPERPWLDGMPRVIFLNDMGDTFSRKLPLDWLSDYMGALEASPHIYMILSKRAARLAAFFNDIWGHVPRNVWPGVTVTTKNTFARVRLLQSVGDEKTTRWVSAEPILESMAELPLAGIAGIMAGGESGSGARQTRPEWVYELEARCKERGIGFFFKQWGTDSNNPDSADPTRKSVGGMSKGGAQVLGLERRGMPDWRASYYALPMESRVETAFKVVGRLRVYRRPGEPPFVFMPREGMPK